MGMIPNPTKKFTVDKPIGEIKEIANRLVDFVNDDCKLKSSDNIINEYEYDFSKVMIGNVITMSLNEVSDNKTEITLTARRVMGAYDKAIEVTTAELDLKALSKAISTLVENPNAEVPQKNSGCVGTSLILIIIMVCSSLFFI